MLRTGKQHSDWWKAKHGQRQEEKDSLLNHKLQPICMCRPPEQRSLHLQSKKPTRLHQKAQQKKTWANTTAEYAIICLFSSLILSVDTIRPSNIRSCICHREQSTFCCPARVSFQQSSSCSCHAARNSGYVKFKIEFVQLSLRYIIEFVLSVMLSTYSVKETWVLYCWARYSALWTMMEAGMLRYTNMQCRV